MSSSYSSSSSPSSTVTEGIDPKYAANTYSFLESVGTSDASVDKFTSKDDYSLILCHHIKSQSVERGHVSCSFSIEPAIANYYNGLHGGVVAAMAERVSIACARTVLADDKDLFLGELSVSYLSSGPSKEEVMVQATAERSGRSITVVSVEFKLKKSGKLLYTARSTFYTTPKAKL